MEYMVVAQSAWLAGRNTTYEATGPAEVRKILINLLEVSGEFPELADVADWANECLERVAKGKDTGFHPQ